MSCRNASGAFIAAAVIGLFLLGGGARGFSGQNVPGAGPGREGRSQDDLRSQLRSTDEEWKVIGPKIRRFVLARQIVEGLTSGGGSGFERGPRGSFRGRPPGGPSGGSFSGPSSFENDSFRPPPGEGPPGGPGGGEGPRPFGGPPPGDLGSPELSSLRGGDFGPVIQAQADLKIALGDPQADPDSLRGKLAALRQARQNARPALAALRKDLVELLTLDQEAALVSLGYLD